MICNRKHHGFVAGAVVLLTAGLPEVAVSQRSIPPIASRDSVTMAVSEMYEAGDTYRFFLGRTYRDLWAARIRVPVLDLRTFAGGLTAVREGGGMQTRSLRLTGADSSEFVFRPVFKEFFGRLPKQFENTVIWDIYRDQGSASHPAATVAAPPILKAVGVLHPVPRFVVMPDDARLAPIPPAVGRLHAAIRFAQRRQRST